MPIDKSIIIKIEGTLNGICHYPLNGVRITRRSSAPTKDQINNDPRFAAVKANTQEFGGASIFSKAICTGLQHNLKTFKDSYFTSRLSGLCRKIIQKGSGNLGQREANLFNQPAALEGFQLHRKYVFNQIYTTKPTVVINSTHTNITIKIAKSSLNNLNQHPKSATHFQLTAAISTVSSHNWHPESKKYQPDYPEANALGTSVATNPLLCKEEHKNIILQLTNPIATTVPANVAITVWLGITFGQENNQGFALFQTAKAMECIAIV